MTPAGVTTRDAAWLVVIDMQRIFGEPSSAWFTPRFAEASAAIQRLRPSFSERTVFTRFLAPERPVGAWVPYYEDWSFALDPANAALYELMPEFRASDGPVIDRTTFGKWDVETHAAIGGSHEIVLVGVSTDCCVISTALAAADAGVHVRVVADACAGVSDSDHERALGAMALYAPLIEVTTVADVLASVS